MTEAYKMIGSVQAFNFGDTLATKVGNFFGKVFVRSRVSGERVCNIH